LLRPSDQVPPRVVDWPMARRFALGLALALRAGLAGPRPAPAPVQLAKPPAGRQFAERLLRATAEQNLRLTPQDYWAERLGRQDRRAPAMGRPALAMLLRPVGLGQPVELVLWWVVLVLLAALRPRAALVLPVELRQQTSCCRRVARPAPAEISVQSPRVVTRLPNRREYLGWPLPVDRKR